MSTTDADLALVPAPLSTRSIVGAAMCIVDTHGLDALTMRRLGDEVGVRAMSIYHHVPSKSALLDLLVATIPETVGTVESWDTPDELVEHYCRDIRTAIRAHPNLAPVVAERLTPAARSSASSATIAQSLVGSDFDHEAATWIVDSFVRFAIGHSIVELAAADTHESDDDAVFDTALRFMVVGLRDELGL
jgi:AcrR family transcriptional regulator